MFQAQTLRAFFAAAASAAAILMSGCMAVPVIAGAARVALEVGKSNAESSQVVNAGEYHVKSQVSDAHSAALSSIMALGGTVKVSDRESGLIVAQKQSWDITVSSVKSGGVTNVTFSFKFVMGRGMDFNSKAEMVAALKSGMESKLGKLEQGLAPVQEVVSSAQPAEVVLAQATPVTAAAAEVNATQQPVIKAKARMKK